jgi:hypothetical protein
VLVLTVITYGILLLVSIGNTFAVNTNNPLNCGLFNSSVLRTLSGSIGVSLEYQHMSQDQVRKAIGMFVATGFNVVTVDSKSVFVKRHARGFRVDYYTDSGLPVQRIVSL